MTKSTLTSSKVSKSNANLQRSLYKTLSRSHTHLDDYLNNYTRTEDSKKSVIYDIKPKRVKVYKSGDKHFDGVEVLLGKRQNRHIDAVLDDLTDKVPRLNFGARKIWTAKGSRRISNVLHMEDNKTYLCTDNYGLRAMQPDNPFYRHDVYGTPLPDYRREWSNVSLGHTGKYKGIGRPTNGNSASPYGTIYGKNGGGSATNGSDTGIGTSSEGSSVGKPKRSRSQDPGRGKGKNGDTEKNKKPQSQKKSSNFRSGCMIIPCFQQQQQYDLSQIYASTDGWSSQVDIDAKVKETSENMQKFSFADTGKVEPKSTILGLYNTRDRAALLGLDGFTMLGVTSGLFDISPNNVELFLAGKTGNDDDDNDDGEGKEVFGIAHRYAASRKLLYLSETELDGIKQRLQKDSGTQDDLNDWYMVSGIEQGLNAVFTFEFPENPDNAEKLLGKLTSRKELSKSQIEDLNSQCRRVTFLNPIGGQYTTESTSDDVYEFYKYHSKAVEAYLAKNSSKNSSKLPITRAELVSLSNSGVGELSGIDFTLASHFTDLFDLYTEAKESLKALQVKYDGFLSGSRFTNDIREDIDKTLHGVKAFHAYLKKEVQEILSEPEPDVPNSSRSGTDSGSSVSTEKVRKLQRLLHAIFNSPFDTPFVLKSYISSLAQEAELLSSYAEKLSDIDQISNVTELARLRKQYMDGKLLIYIPPRDVLKQRAYSERYTSAMKRYLKTRAWSTDSDGKFEWDVSKVFADREAWFRRAQVRENIECEIDNFTRLRDQYELDRLARNLRGSKNDPNGVKLCVAWNDAVIDKLYAGRPKKYAGRTLFTFDNNREDNSFKLSDRPTSVRVMDVTDTGVMLRWDPFSIEHSKNSIAQVWVQTREGRSSSNSISTSWKPYSQLRPGQTYYRVQGLEPNTEYKFKTTVSAYGIEYGSSGETDVITTQEGLEDLPKASVKPRKELGKLLSTIQADMNPKIDEMSRLHQCLLALCEYKRMALDAEKNGSTSKTKPEDFDCSIWVNHFEKVPIIDGSYTTYCLNCTYICHRQCKVGKESRKYCCIAMSNRLSLNAVCAQCVGSCSWVMHRTLQYYVRYHDNVIEERLNMDTLWQEFYLEDRAGVEDNWENIAYGICERYDEIAAECAADMDRIVEGLTEYGFISLRPNQLTAVDYIGLIYESNVKQGQLQEAEQADSLNTARSGGNGATSGDGDIEDEEKDLVIVEQLQRQHNEAWDMRLKQFDVLKKQAQLLQRNAEKDESEPVCPTELLYQEHLIDNEIFVKHEFAGGWVENYISNYS